MSTFQPNIDKLKNNPRKYVESLSVKNHVKLLQILSDAYYNSSSPIICDEIFDLVKDYLKERDSDNPYLLEVGIPSSKRIVKLPYSMYSLEKIKPDTDVLSKWCKEFKGPYIISDKLDGISAQLYKDESGKLFLYSRGDSTTGQNITHLITHIFDKKVLNKIPNNTSIRGELIISKQNFNKIKDNYENARNAVGGLVNSKRLKKDVLELVDFVSYSLLHPLYKKDKQMELLKDYNLKVVYHKKLTSLTNHLLSENLELRRKESDYDIDGIVVFDNSEVYRIEDKNPSYAFAFKMILDDQIAEATVEDVLWEVSKDKYIKPRIKIVPVKLVGVTITYATAFNAKYVFDNKLGPGALIKLIRSGDVIPHIIEVIKPAEEPKMPNISYTWSESGVDIIASNIRTNSKVYNQVLVKQITFFFKTLNVKYINEGIITKLIDNGYDSLEKILTMNIKKASLIDGLGEKVLQKIFDSIKESIETCSLEMFMYASQMFGRGIGEKKIKLILDHIPNILELDINQELRKKINNIDGFSDKTTDKFIENLNEFKIFFKEIRKIISLDHLIVIKKKENKEHKLNGMIIVFTGFRNKNWKEFIEKNGGKVTDSVSKNTNIVVYEELKGSKIEKAKELGIMLMYKDDFMKTYID